MSNDLKTTVQKLKTLFEPFEKDIEVLKEQNDTDSIVIEDFDKLIEDLNNTIKESKDIINSYKKENK